MVPIEPGAFLQALPPKTPVRLVFEMGDRAYSLETEVLRHSGTIFEVRGTLPEGLKAQTPILVSFGTAKALFQFISPFVRSEGKPREAILLERPATWRRVQRRTCFRHEVRFKLKAAIVPEDKHQAIMEEIEGICLNLSASGMLIAFARRIEIKTRLHLTFSLPIEGTLGRPLNDIPVEVVRHVQHSGEDLPLALFFTGVSFMRLKVADEDRLMQFIWKQEVAKAR